MAAASAQSLPLSSPPPPSPSRARLSKVLTAGRRRSSDVHSDSAAGAARGWDESLSVAKSPSIQSQRSPSRDGSTKSSGSSGVKKLIPGLAKRERKKLREEELNKIAQEESARGRQPAAHGHDPRPVDLTRSRSSLVTVDSEVESPPALASRDSHSGYLTTTSPLIKTSTIDAAETVPVYNAAARSQNTSTEQFPAIVEPPPPNPSPSPKSTVVDDVPVVVPPIPALVDTADTLQPSANASRARAKSPARRIKDVFSRNGKSPRISPDRRETEPILSDNLVLKHVESSFGQRRLSNNPEARGPSPLRAQTISTVQAPRSALPVLPTDPEAPKTPPGSIFAGPTTTVTPPTPTDPDNSRPSWPSSPVLPADGSVAAEQGPSPAQDAPQPLPHRRVRSASGALHQKSKLSTSMMPPLTPTIEEKKSPSPSIGGPAARNPSSNGFFSTWMTAAQNAATSITNLTNQNRSRSGTGPTDPNKPTTVEEPPQEEAKAQEEGADDQMPKKELAVTTLGTGDLNLSHLGIDSTERRAASPARSDYEASVRGDDAAARTEDLLAKRAVSQAYEKGRSGEATPVAEIPDPVAAVRPTSGFDGVSGSLTPPNGSIFEGETNGVKRTNSVRSKLQNRRSRGSSVTTAQSAIGAIIGASTATIANPAAAPKLPGFAMAPKQRNRAFHQQFRSVPEDDFLIEDYSCALQKEILLAGRVYISEGHICFSSNILGWVTTLIISFEEIVSIERENTAIVIPNAIAVQTLHARHIFRSLLSREATYDLMIGIWRVSHPDSFQKSKNGQKLAAGIASADNVAATSDDVEAPPSDDNTDDDSASDHDEGSAPSIGSSGSMAGSEFVEPNSLSRKPSGGHTTPAPALGAPAAPSVGEATASVLPIVSAVDGAPDFPGPPTHAPTECTDSATHYDKVIKDELIQAPLGKIYSLLYGPQSAAFLRKFLVDGVSKAQDLQLEDDKRGLDGHVKTRKYQYIKPLGGSIGPKQTNCITTETLDAFDLEKAVSVTCTTQTPDVPSGNSFSTKTRYCLTWAPGNATRFQMNMTIEWTAKSWLKGPIEKGALDGQTQYGDDLVRTLKNALGRTRAATAGSKILKNGKKKRKSPKREKDEPVQSSTSPAENWGPLEMLRPTVGPLISTIHPLVQTNLVIALLGLMVLWMWFRGPPSPNVALSRSLHLERGIYYDDLWRREESDLWEWLQDRAGVDSSIIRNAIHDQTPHSPEHKQQEKQRKQLLQSKDMQARLREENKSMKEMEEAVRVTQERLDALQKALNRQRSQ